MKTQDIKIELEGMYDVLEQFVRQEETISSLAQMIGCSNNEMHYVLSAHFTDIYQARKKAEKSCFLHACESINLGIPLEIIQLHNPILMDITTVNNVRKVLKRGFDKYKIEPELNMITMKKFKMFYNRLLIESELEVSPIYRPQHKDVAKKLNVSRSLVTKVSQELERDAILHVEQKHALYYNRIRMVMDIISRLKKGSHYEKIENRFNISRAVIIDIEALMFDIDNF